LVGDYAIPAKRLVPGRDLNPKRCHIRIRARIALETINHGTPIVVFIWSNNSMRDQSNEFERS
jgi:hypothetical protein